MSHMLREHIASEYVAVDVDQALEAAGELARDADPASRAELWLMQLLLPDLVEAVEQLIIASDEQPRVRHMAGGLLTYVYNPLDLIDDDSVVGRVDDALVCALGLRRLRELERVELSPGIAACCDLADRQLRVLNADLRDGIRDFVADLERASVEAAPR